MHGRGLGVLGPAIAQDSLRKMALGIARVRAEGASSETKMEHITVIICGRSRSESRWSTQPRFASWDRDGLQMSAENVTLADPRWVRCRVGSGGERSSADRLKGAAPPTILARALHGGSPT